MSNPEHPVGGEVDPSEGSVNEGSEQQSIQAADDDEGENFALVEVDPSEGPTE